MCDSFTFILVLINFPLNFSTDHEMPNITELVHIIPPDADDKPEDIFAAAPGLIFTDDLRNLHGDPGSTIVYKSRRFGDIALRTADPEGEDERKLFSHYLWNAGIKIAELISREDDSEWSVQDQSVLELGAGGDASLLKRGRVG